MNKLLALADRVEKLTGPDRHIMHEVFDACAPQGEVVRICRWWERFEVLARADAWTDAAMMLVPKGRFVGALNQVDVDGEWYARIEAHDAVFEDAIAAAAALALVAASLRARAHGGGEG